MSYDEIQKNEGKVFPERHLAVFRDVHGKIHEFSSYCTHEECDIVWNEKDRAWDCPCHGSRFTAMGQVTEGPAIKPLRPPVADDPAQRAAALDALLGPDNEVPL